MKNTTKIQPSQPTTANPNFLILGFADNKVPDVKELPSKEWIQFGEDNKFPNHLIYLYSKSSNHNAIVDGKSNYILGNGFPTPVQANQNETFNKFIHKLIIDIELHGGCRAEVIYNFGGKAQLRHLPFEKLRRSKDKKGYWYSEDWTALSKKENEPKFIPDFDPNVKKGAQVFAYNEYRPGCKIYPLPGYFGALNDIETDVEISVYNLSIMKNGQFSGKFISFFNGDPTDEVKDKLEKKWNEKFNGSGNAGKTLLAFNKATDKEPHVLDMSSSELPKLMELLNKTVQGEIFAGHQVTSPMLFGIKEEGQLGGRAELETAYEIFKNTYVNKKQEAVNEIAAILLPLLGAPVEKLRPTDAVNLALNPVDFKELLPKEWIFEKLGIDITKYPSAQVPAIPQAPTVNENIKNMTGRQYQQIQRIIREFKKGKLSKLQASTLLKTGLSLSDEEIGVMLEENFMSHFESMEFSEEEVSMMFSEIGVPKSDYEILESGENVKMSFADLSQVDSNILDMIRKDKRISAKDIAIATKTSPEYISERLKHLTDEGVLKSVSKKLGQDVIIEHSVNPEVIDTKPKAETVEVYVKYSYEVKPGVGPAIIETTRPFCRKLIELDKLYSRAEIEQISQRLGYSVFDRSGGFWGHKPQCRHEWKRNRVIKRRKYE